MDTHAFCEAHEVLSKTPVRRNAVAPAAIEDGEDDGSADEHDEDEGSAAPYDDGDDDEEEEDEDEAFAHVCIAHDSHNEYKPKVIPI